MLISYISIMKIDEDTLQDVINLGYDKDHVCESLCNRLQNEVYENKSQRFITFNYFIINVR
jgi:hypothetical protein